MEDDSYRRYKNIVKELPWLPEIEDDEEDEIPGKYLAIYKRKEEIRLELKKYDYPPIFAKKAWTKSVLQKDIIRYYKPSQNIGANFVPGAQRLRMQELRVDKRRSQHCFLGSDGNLFDFYIKQKLFKSCYWDHSI